MQRQPIHAGRFYPAQADELRTLTRSLVTPSREAPRAYGFVLPHGPLGFSGRVAGAALSIAVPDEIAIIIAPNHAALGPRAAIVCAGSYGLPGCTVPIEETLAESVRALGGLSENDAGLAEDHAIESILPLLVAARPRLAIVPIAVHDLAPSTAARIGAAIADAIVGRGGGVTVIATTNLAHYAPNDAMAEVTDPLLEAAAQLDDEALVAHARARTERPGPVIETCGLSALLTAVFALRGLGIAPGTIAARGTSADVSGERGLAVGYGSIVYTSRASRTSIS